MMELGHSLRRSLGEQRKDLVEMLAVGAVPDYPSYCKAVGAIQALDRVLLEIEEYEKKAVED